MLPSGSYPGMAPGDVIRAIGAQALHDEVVQNLALAALALDTGEIDRARDAVAAALARSQRLVGELLDGLSDLKWPHTLGLGESTVE